MNTVLITGGCGFLGSHLAAHALAQGSRVITVDNYSTARPHYTPTPHPHRLDIRADAVAPWSEWASIVPSDWWAHLKIIYHFASPASPIHYTRLDYETVAVNTLGLQNAIEWANQFGARVVFASTSEIYGDPLVTPQPETYWGNVNSFGERACYDEAKRLGETLIYLANKKAGNRHGLVRIFNTYGPHMNPDDGRVIINFLTQALRGQPLTIYGDGTQTRSFCYVDDLVAGILAYGAAKIYEPVNIGNDREFTIAELATIIQKLYPEKNLRLEHRAALPDDPRQRCPDLTRAKQLLAPWQPRVNLEEGLQRMAAWLETELAA